MSKVFFSLSFLKLFNSILKYESAKNEYKINIIDNNLKTSLAAYSLIDENGFYYIITGEDLNSSYNPDANLFKRTILKYDINSNIFINKYSFNSSYPFILSNNIFTSTNQYLLTISKSSIEIFEWDKTTEYENKNINIIGKQTLLKIYAYYYYVFIQEKTENEQIFHYAIINKIELEEDETPSYRNIKSSNPIKVASYLNIISCENTKDNQYIICVFYSEDFYFMISVYDLNLNLIQKEKEELIDEINQFDLFIKILYFKDYNKYIIINSQNNHSTRLRYIKYSNGNFINLLPPITDTNEQYLDIQEPQYNPFSNYNDAIMVAQNKFIKISLFNNQIIITVFQFYDGDTALIVKSYKMNNSEQIPLESNKNPYITIIRNSLLICLSTYDNKPTTGYLFLNYANAKDLTLIGNSIMVKDLIYMENRIYNLDLKIKIIEIPNNFIFAYKNSSLSNYTEIKTGDILELDTEIILRQYKIKEEHQIFKYKGIAEGNDDGFYYYQMHPSGHVLPSSSDVYLEGKEGHLYIDFNECLEGYYQLEDDLKICTNINPRGYYLNFKDNLYKKCSKPCLDCSGPYISDNEMNCISCLDSYIITEDTYSCYDYIPNNYIIEDNILKRCHPLCSNCIKPSKNNSEMNCLECMHGYFLKTETYNCIRPEEYKKREEKNLSTKNSKFLLLFIFILIFSILTTLSISLSCLCRRKEETENEEQKDYEENQKIINKDDNTDSDINDYEQRNTLIESIN